MTSEIKHAWDDNGPRKCVHCGASGKLKRLFSPTGIAFKGSGFYVTDSKSHNSAVTTTQDSTPKEAVKPATDTKPTEPQAVVTETKSEPPKSSKSD